MEMATNNVSTNGGSTNKAQFIQQSFKNLNDFFSSGKTLPYEYRKNALIKLGENLKKNEQKLYDALEKDLGKSNFESFVAEVGFIWDEIQYFVKHLHKWMKPQKVSTPITNQPGSSKIHYNPYGVCLVLSPWNYPVQLTLAPLLGSIAAGNCTLVKPSEQAPNVAQALEDLIHESFDPNFVQVVRGGRNEVGEILKQPFDFIFFTGGTRVGQIVYESAAKHLTPVVLELGGKSPCIVDTDAPLKVTARRIAWGKFLNCGQTCTAPDYLFVHESQYDEVVQLLRENIQSFYGTDIKNNKDFGRIINQTHFDRLSKLVKETKPTEDQSSWDRETRFIPPTILDHIELNSAIMSEEIFGPILPVFKYKNFSEVTQYIRKNAKPLAVYYFGKNKQHEDIVTNTLQFGGGCINDTVMHVANPHLPFGGVGMSGLGSYHGQKSFTCFSHAKSMLSKNTAIDVPLRYPPYDKKIGLMKKVYRY